MNEKAKHRPAEAARACVVFGALAVILTAIPLYADTAERELYAEAEGFYHGRYYSTALESYARFVDRFPFSELVPDAQYRRAVCLYRLKKYGEALPLLDSIERRFRSTRFLSLVPFWRAMCLFETKEYPRAIAAFDAFLEARGAGDTALTAQALYYRAAGRTETGALDAAGADLRRFLKDHPRDELAGHAFLLLAHVHARRGDGDALLAQHGDPRAAALPDELRDKFLLYYAGALAGKGRRDEAAAVYERLLDAAPEVAAAALAKLFTLAQREGRVREMELLARRAEDVLSGDRALLVEFWTTVGLADAAADRFESAEYYLTRAWNARATTQLGEAVPLALAELYARRGSGGQALAVLEEFRASGKGRDDDVLFRLARLSAAEGDDAKAASYFKEFIAAYPASPRLSEARYLLASVCLRQGDVERGLEASAGALARLPDGHKLKPALVRVRARLLMKKGDAAGAETLLAGFLAARKDDYETRREYLALLVNRKKFAAVAASLKESPVPAGLKMAKPALYLTLKYYEGLALIGLKEYARALAAFAEFEAPDIEKRGVGELAPTVLFYRGWAFYRTGKTAEAAPLFKRCADEYPQNGLYARALYLAGWCEYSNGKYDEAARHFRALADRAPDGETSMKGAFFLGKSLAAGGKEAEALAIFPSIFNRSPESAFAPDALFEYARLLAGRGRTNEAAEAWADLAEKYPRHGLAGEALWSRARLFFSVDDRAKALAAFALYREKFPNGSQTDASWYWSGVCAAGGGDRASALEYWEKLIEGFGDSSFRPEALKKAAEAYRLAGANDKALAALRKLSADYPREAKAIGAEDKARELHYLVMGYGGREAELSALVEKEGGLATRAGRRAMADLAAHYLSEKERARIDLAYPIALKLSGLADDPETAARARFLLGEYFFAKKDYARAGNEYLDAAASDPGDRERAAHALYRAAYSMKLAGDPASARELVARLAKSFPSSRWAAEGRKLLEAGS